MEKRRVIKKGRVVITRKGQVVLKLAEKILSDLKPFCRKIQIVGSIRRGEKNPIDIDMVAISKVNGKEKIEGVLARKGKLVRHGEKVVSYMVQGVKIEVYFADFDSWGAALLTYTGSSEYNIGLRMHAKKKGFKLNQYGLFKGDEKIAGKTEKGIYAALGKSLKKPQDR